MADCIGACAKHKSLNGQWREKRGSTARCWPRLRVRRGTSSVQVHEEQTKHPTASRFKLSDPLRHKTKKQHLATKQARTVLQMAMQLLPRRRLQIHSVCPDHCQETPERHQRPSQTERHRRPSQMPRVLLLPEEDGPEFHGSQLSARSHQAAQQELSTAERPELLAQSPLLAPLSLTLCLLHRETVLEEFVLLSPSSSNHPR
mmetsp:Transcript_16566/g.44843  ORF Transcript_16566/g.44843 Transcript_16566/m.44843 type:complete len:202 (+) Transcript_16566:37-642(+)